MCWIWNDPKAADKAKPGHVYFRKTFLLGSRGRDRGRRCDNSFTFFLNGRNVGSGSDFKKAFLFDLRPFLKPGDNLFAIDAVNHLPDNSASGARQPPPGTENPAGLLLLRPSAPPRCRQPDFASDDSWVCSDVRHDHWETLGVCPR